MSTHQPLHSCSIEPSTSSILAGVAIISSINRHFAQRPPLITQRFSGKLNFIVHTCTHAHHKVCAPTHTKMSALISPLQIKIERKEWHHLRQLIKGYKTSYLYPQQHEAQRSSHLIIFSVFQHTTSLVFTNQVSAVQTTQQIRAVHTKGKLFQCMHHTHTQNTNKRKLSQASPTLQLIPSANTHSHHPPLLQFKNKNLFANNTLNYLVILNLIINSSANNKKINNSAYSPNSSNYYNDLATFNE